LSFFYLSFLLSHISVPSQKSIFQFPNILDFCEGTEIEKITCARNIGAPAHDSSSANISRLFHAHTTRAHHKHHLDREIEKNERKMKVYGNKGRGEYGRDEERRIIEKTRAPLFLLIFIIIKEIKA